MAFEEIGIRLRTDGVVDATNGVTLLDAAVDGLGKTIVRIVPGVDGLGKTVVNVAPAVDGLNRVIDGTTPTIGGVTAAIKPLNLALGGMAAAAGLTAYAWHQGSLEAQAYQRALILTGNAAGTTVGQQQAAAGQIDALVGTQAQAAQVLAQLVSTGNVSRGQLEVGARAAIELQRTFGIEADKTVAALSALGRDPVRAVDKLNEQYRFLTLSTWEQIRALAQQGRTAEASAVAQEAFSKTAIERAGEMEKNLGTLQKAWRGVGEVAKEAWDFMLGVGRQKTVEEQLKSVQIALAAPERRGGNPLQNQARREALREQEAALQETLRLQMRSADSQARQAAEVQAAIDRDTKKPPRAAAAPADPYKAINDHISQRLVLSAAELAAGEKLSEADRTRLALLAQIQAAEAKGGAAAADQARQRVGALFTLLGMQERQRDAAAEEAERQKAFQKDRAQATQAAEREVLTLEQQRDRLAEETAEIGLNARAVLERRQALIDADIAAREAHIARISGLPAYEAEATALRQQVDLLKQIKGQQAGKAAAQERQAEAEDLTRRTQAVYDSIMDGLTNGFRDGRRPADIFLNEFKAQAARTLLRIPVQMISQATTSLFGSLFTGLFGSGGGGGAGVVSGGSGMTLGGGGGIFGGYRAGGGDVDAGRAYVVGEKGPELLYMGRQRGNVVSNDNLRASGGGRVVNYAPVINIDARTDKAEVMALVMRASQAAQADLLEKMDRREV